MVTAGGADVARHGKDYRHADTSGVHRPLGLEVEVIEAIARHERIPEIVAAELGNHLLATGRDGTHG
jgi:hypothetical protein